MMKLRGGASSNGSRAYLAALDSRVLIGFDPVHTLSRLDQTELVKSHMRSIYNIPESREYMSSGYPSEPVLSEAAGRILNSSPDKPIDDKAPEILLSIQNNGLLAKGERGELVARTLLTVAHDKAANDPSTSWTAHTQYHRPIKLMDFLKNLLAPEVLEKVCEATPFRAYPGALKLEAAFADAWINFSHFVRLGDYKSFDFRCATELLERGAAIQTYDCQPDQDLAIPLHNGDVGSVIDLKTTSGIQVQVRNVRNPSPVVPKLSLIGECPAGLPMLSIVMQLGVDDDYKGPLVEVITELKGGSTPAGNTRSTESDLEADVERRHYIIVLYGYTEQTYPCIGMHASEYHSLLRTERFPFDGYPRGSQTTDLKRNRTMFDDAVHELKSMVYLYDPSCMAWQD
ncbi:hypothetical protein E1B28_008375 [Marasmius oreades]|uniref:Uncharacterized protein n=1 Tax=Marasmius oreades TaxID=181124 RepID=A0A9P7RYV2_9AGAR|nr:uncharacterized protein E1B28_008375 [Marasmius oreades]KAG7091988.1 hypothetical protein E1B28_008375 [Marasmius oreades]